MVSNRRKFMTKAFIPLVGILGGGAALNIVQPSQTIRVTAVNVDITTSIGNSVTLFGDDIADTTGIGATVKVGTINNDQYPQAFSDFRVVFAPTSANKPPNKDETLSRINDLYQGKALWLLIKLAGENIAIFAVGYASADALRRNGVKNIKKMLVDSLEKNPIYYNSRLDEKPFGHEAIYIINHLREFLNEHIEGRPNSSQKLFNTLVCGATVCVLILGGNAYQLSNATDTTHKIEGAVRSPINKYLVSNTSTAAADLSDVTENVGDNLIRITDINSDLREAKKAIDANEANEVNTFTLLVTSDSHNLPVVPTTTEAIARASRADAIIGLGDWLNTGKGPEKDALGGLPIGETKFSGYDDILTCVGYDAERNCIKEGAQFPFYGLTGNHDTKDLMEVLNKLGVKDLTKERPDFLPNVFALNDACYVDGNDCGGNYHQNEKVYAEAALVKFKEKYSGKNAVNKPRIGLFASEDAAKVFIGEIDTIIHGGAHVFKAYEKNNSKVISIGSIGKGFPRGAPYANAALLEIASTPGGAIKEIDGYKVALPDRMNVLDCKSLQWDPYQIRTEALAPCFP